MSAARRWAVVALLGLALALMASNSAIKGGKGGGGGGGSSAVGGGGGGGPPPSNGTLPITLPGTLG